MLHINRPTQHPLQSVKFLRPRITRVLQFTSFVTMGRNFTRVKGFPAFDFGIWELRRMPIFQLIHMPHEVPSPVDGCCNLRDCSEPADNASMAYPHLRRLEDPLISELVQFLEYIVAIPSRGKPTRLLATPLLAFTWPPACLISALHISCLQTQIPNSNPFPYLRPTQQPGSGILDFHARSHTFTPQKANPWRKSQRMTYSIQDDLI